MAEAEIGFIGLAVMGQNLVLNMADHGISVSVYNRTASTMNNFLAGSAKGKSITGAQSIDELCHSLQSPRRIMLMVKAGSAVDQVIGDLIPRLDKGDTIIDGGNSLFSDSQRRPAIIQASA